MKLIFHHLHQQTTIPRLHNKPWKESFRKASRDPSPRRLPFLVPVTSPCQVAMIPYVVDWIRFHKVLRCMPRKMQPDFVSLPCRPRKRKLALLLNQPTVPTDAANRDDTAAEAENSTSTVTDDTKLFNSNGMKGESVSMTTPNPVIPSSTPSMVSEPAPGNCSRAVDSFDHLIPPSETSPGVDGIFTPPYAEYLSRSTTNSPGIDLFKQRRDAPSRSLDTKYKSAPVTREDKEKPSTFQLDLGMTHHQGQVSNNRPITEGENSHTTRNQDDHKQVSYPSLDDDEKITRAERKAVKRRKKEEKKAAKKARKKMKKEKKRKRDIANPHDYISNEKSMTLKQADPDVIVQQAKQSFKKARQSIDSNPGQKETIRLPRGTVLSHDRSTITTNSVDPLRIKSKDPMVQAALRSSQAPGLTKKTHTFPQRDTSSRDKANLANVSHSHGEGNHFGRLPKESSSGTSRMSTIPFQQSRGGLVTNDATTTPNRPFVFTTSSRSGQNSQGNPPQGESDRVAFHHARSTFPNEPRIQAMQGQRKQAQPSGVDRLAAPQRAPNLATRASDLRDRNTQHRNQVSSRTYIKPQNPRVMRHNPGYFDRDAAQPLQPRHNPGYFDGDAAQPLQSRRSTQNRERTTESTNPAGLTPIIGLCGSKFLDTWGDVAEMLATGLYTIDSDLTGQQLIIQNRKIVLHACSLVDSRGVDIEIPRRGGCLIYALSALEHPTTAESATQSLVRLAAVGRYAVVYVFVCYDIPVTHVLARHLSQMQNAVLYDKGTPPTRVCFITTTPRSIAPAIAETIGAACQEEFVPTNIAPLLHNKRAFDMTWFLVQAVPIFTVFGAVQCLELAYNIVGASRRPFGELLRNPQLRQQIVMASSSNPSKAPEIHPLAMTQLTAILKVRFE